MRWALVRLSDGKYEVRSPDGRCVWFLGPLIPQDIQLAADVDLPLMERALREELEHFERGLAWELEKMLNKLAEGGMLMGLAEAVRLAHTREVKDVDARLRGGKRAG